MNGKELKNKPLVEAILEFKWELPAQTTSGIETDPHYRLLLGRFSEKMESDYPFHEPLPTSQIPDAMAVHMAQHRFRASEGGWPAKGEFKVQDLTLRYIDAVDHKMKTSVSLPEFIHRRKS